MKKSGKIYAKYVADGLGIGCFVSFFIFIITGNGAWLGIFGIPLASMIIYAVIWDLAQLAKRNGVNFFLIDLVVKSLEDPVEAGLLCKPYHTIPFGTAPSEDTRFKRIVTQLNESETAKDKNFVPVKVSEFFKGVEKDVEGMDFAYSEVIKANIDEVEELELDEAEQVEGKDEHEFDIRKAKIILWACQGKFSDVTRPRNHSDHGLFSVFERKMLLTKCSGMLIREVHPGILLIYLEHTIQQTYDKSFDVKAALKPNSVVVRASCGYASVVVNEPSHLKAENQDLEQDRNSWMSSAMNATDKKNKLRAEQATRDDEVENPQPAPVVLPGEKKYGAGICIGWLTCVPILLFVLQILWNAGIRFFGG